MHSIEGVIPPVVTPLKQLDQLDVAAVDRISRHLISGGVNGLFVLGTTGEGPALNYQIRYEMVERSCEAAEGKVPVLVGVTDCSFVESVELCQHAESSGADMHGIRADERATRCSTSCRSVCFDDGRMVP